MSNSFSASKKLNFQRTASYIDNPKSTKVVGSPIRILFLLPPTLQYSDFVHPPANVGTIRKGGKDFGMILTDLPLGIVSLSAYLKKYIQIPVKNVLNPKNIQFKNALFGE